MVFVYYQFHAPPVFFHEAAWERARTAAPDEARRIEAAEQDAFARGRAALDRITASAKTGEDVADYAIARTTQKEIAALRVEARALVKLTVPRAETKDADYIFIGFVTRQFPPGLVGLLLAVILCAAMSATAAALSALGSTTMVDFYRARFRPSESDAHYLFAARLFTVGWGVVAMLFAGFASLIAPLRSGRRGRDPPPPWSYGPRPSC
jgi:hypothetical protein